MIEQVKTYFFEVIVKNVTPKVTAAVMSAGITFLIAHQELMQQMGITFYPNFDGKWLGAAPTGQLLIIEFDTLGKWGAAGLVILITTGWAFLQHHATATITGAPQSGDKRITPSQPVVDGDRASDPPKAV